MITPYSSPVEDPHFGPSASSIAEAFSKALGIANEWVGSTAPNPAVGCVLLDEMGELLVAAAHERAGHLHAEALAIEAARIAGVLHRIHTVVVTLEPCRHQGRTPACTDAILKTPAKMIWVGSADPNRHVAGGGTNALREAGVVLKSIADLPHPDARSLADASARLIAPFEKLCRTGRPFVVIKQAFDRKGRTVPRAGQTTFTSQESLVRAHQLRKGSDAILTGSGTVLADNPAFTVRHVGDFVGKQRKLVIMDRRRRVSEEYLQAAQMRGFAAFQADNIDDVLDQLGEAGCLQVLVEAGATLTEAVRDANVWDEQVIFRQNAIDAPDTMTIISNRRLA